MPQKSKLRELNERSGALFEFLPNPPEKDFRERGAKGFLQVQAISIAELDDEPVRGWAFSIFNGDDELIELRYLDREEISQLEKLLTLWGDDDIESAFEFRSIEGVVFK